jgi:hypothetical protein
MQIFTKFSKAKGLLAELVIPDWISNSKIDSKFIIPTYHSVSDCEIPHLSKIIKIRDKRTFIKDLDFFLKYFTPVNSYQEFLKPSKVNKNFILTFDDGYQEIYNVIAPILVEKGVNAIFFLTTEFLDNKSLFYRNKASLIVLELEKIKRKQIKLDFLKLDFGIIEINEILKIGYRNRSILDKIALRIDLDFNDYLNSKSPYLTTEMVFELKKKGFIIGSHTVDHAHYSELSITDQIYDSSFSSNLIFEKFKLDYKVFAFPFSDKFAKPEIFNTIYNDIDFTFGTNHLKISDFRHIQRFGVEGNRSGLSMQEILNKEIRNGYRS